MDKEKKKIVLSDMQKSVGAAMTGSGNDVIVLSPTGTGKTLGYQLPLARLTDEQGSWPQAIVVLPGRELALQSLNVWKELGNGISAFACYGGRPAMDEHRSMRKVCPKIIFGTPGRLNDHIDKGNFDVSNVRLFIIDEFDKCLSMGFYDEMKQLMGKLPRTVRHILLSATDSDEISHFIPASRSFTRIDFCNDSGARSEQNVKTFTVRSSSKDKLGTLRSLLVSLGNSRSIIFVNYRDATERVNDFLKEQGFVTSCLHGGLEQKEREAELYKFSNKSTNVLVATNLASRGLDIADVDNIIHYHLPETEEDYLHRTGRTARWHKSGRNFFILGPEEHLPEYVDAAVEEYVPDNAVGSIPQPEMTTLYIGKGKKDKISKGDVLGFLCKTGGLSATEVGRIDIGDRFCYVAVRREKAGEVLAMTAGKKIKGIKTVFEKLR